jgi:hypothetical protein
MTNCPYLRVECHTTKGVTKLLEIVEGAIIPDLYDFSFEREVVMEAHNDGTIRVQVKKYEKDLPSTKKPRTEEQSSSPTQL